jgi:transcriptional regulator of arginine metabolism
MKAHRQQLILDLVDSELITSQEELRTRLQDRGVETTQATLSRDIRDLRLVKQASDGAYRRPRAEMARTNGSPLAHAVAEYLRRVDVVAHMLVLKTDTGQAQPLGVALDRAQMPEIVGTIAGDDTILVICRTPEEAERAARGLESLRAGGST